MMEARSVFLHVLIILMVIDSTAFKIFKSVEEVLKETTPAPPTLHGVAEMPGKLKDDPDSKGFRITQGRLPFMNFLFDYEVELEYFPFEFNLSKPDPQDESFSSIVHSCIVTPNGIEYEGKMFYTVSKNICINWNNPLLYEQLEIKPYESKDFPDKSIDKARSYCRNPDNSPSPWCYRKDNKQRENCSIATCDRKRCILTGPGIEYKGNVTKSFYGTCEMWSFDVPKENITSARGFLVQNHCRNPTFDPVGPYCYVRQHYHDGGAYPWLIKSYCDIPLCDMYFSGGSYEGQIYYRKRGPYLFCVVGRHEDYYTHYSRFSSDLNTMNISIKLWDPSTLFNAQVKVALSVLAIPANGSEFLRWDMGFELLFSNNQTGAIVNPPEDSILIPVPGLLSGIRWCHLTLTWDDTGLNVTYTNDEESLPIYQFKEPLVRDTIRGLYMNKLQYVSVLGTPALMRIAFHQAGTCEEQITTEEVYARFYPFFREGPVRRLRFGLKTTLTVFLLLRFSPLNTSDPEVLISLNGRGYSYLILRTFQNRTNEGGEEELQVTEIIGDTTLFNWTFFTLSLRGEELRLSMHSAHSSRYLFDYKHFYFRSLRFFGIASMSVAYWTLGCSPADIANEPYLPFGNNRTECSRTIDDTDYMGQTSFTERGRACLPWISDFVSSIEKMYVDNNTFEAVNFCRNVIEQGAAYCYVYNRLSNKTVKRENCLIPKCISKMCRTYGVGVGNRWNLTMTISGRECKYWTEADEKFKAMFRIDNNASEQMKQLYDISYAENFCRNPNKDISGPWCSTTDPDVETDLCELPDCDRPIETIVLLTTNVKHETYIKPMWRVTGWKFWVKKWQRNTDVGLTLTLLRADKKEYFQIIFEGKNSSKILLVYHEEKAEPRMVERYAPYDFLLFTTNEWTGYHLTLREESMILGLVGERKPFLNWNYTFMFEKILEIGLHHTFLPFFLTYEKTEEGVLAMSFNPEDQFVEILTPEEQGTYYPINYGKKERLYLPTHVLTFNFRGQGNVLILLYNTIALGPQMTIELGSGELYDRMISKMYILGHEVALEVARTDGPTINDDKWAEFMIRMTEEMVDVFHDDEELSSWLNPKPLIAYYFRLETKGNITWISNSPAPEMDTRPIDGGWAEWTEWDCSVTCGGGRGQRERSCDSPPPSLFGMPCRGNLIDFGLCNTFPCGDIPPEIIDIIAERMKRYVHTMTVYKGDNITISCYPDIVDLIEDHSSEYQIYWDRNGVPITNLTPIGSLIEDHYNFIKVEAELNDSGVYACCVYTTVVNFRPIQITSLLVKTKKTSTFIGFTGEYYTFQCHNQVLSFVYKDLELIWLHDGQSVEKYSETYLQVMNKKEIKLELSDTGIWECAIRNKKFNLKWHTNWYNIQVNYRNDFVKYLMDDNKYTKHIFKNFEPLYVEISFTILVFIVATLTTGAAFLLVYIHRIVRRQLKVLYKTVQEKLRGESPDQGYMPHTSSENDLWSNSDSSLSSMSSGYKRYIERELDPTIYYFTDEYISVSDSRDHLGLQPMKKKRVIIRDIDPRRKRYKRIGSKVEKSHKDSEVRRSPNTIFNFPFSRKSKKIDAEAKRELMLSASSISTSSSTKSLFIYDPNPDGSYPIDLLNYKYSPGNPIDPLPTDTPSIEDTPPIQDIPSIEVTPEGSHRTSDFKLNTDDVNKDLNLNTNKSNEEAGPSAIKDVEMGPSAVKDVKKGSSAVKENPFKNYVANSPFSRPKCQGLYWRQLEEYKKSLGMKRPLPFDSDSDSDSESRSYTYDLDSLILASTDSELGIDPDIF